MLKQKQYIRITVEGFSYELQKSKTILSIPISVLRTTYQKRMHEEYKHKEVQIGIQNIMLKVQGEV